MCRTIYFEAYRRSRVCANCLRYLYSKQFFVVKIDLIVVWTSFTGLIPFTRKCFRWIWALRLVVLLFTILGYPKWVMRVACRRLLWCILILLRFFVRVVVTELCLSGNCDICLVLYQKGDNCCECGWLDGFVWHMLLEVLWFGQFPILLFTCLFDPPKHMTVAAACWTICNRTV